MRDHSRDVDAYMRAVQTGKIRAGQLVKAAIERHLKDLQTAGKRGFYFDPEAANAAINFFPLLRHTTGEFDGKPFELMPWQKFLVWVLFGWRRTADGLRRFRHAFLSMGRGNGKSPLAAAIALMLFCCDQPLEARAEVVVAATMGRQARIVWDEAKRFAQRIPSLRKRLQLYESKQSARMLFTLNDSTFEPMEHSVRGHDGQVLHGAILDELHAWREEHRITLDNIETAMAKRRQPLKIIITTAGSEKSGIWLEEYEACCKIVRGVVRRDDYFVLIYQLDEDDDIYAEKNWIKANPNLGVSVNLDGLRSLAAQAKTMASKRVKFRRYHCNLLTSSLSKAITPELWKKGDQELPKLAGRPCHGGIDLGWRNDLAAFGLVFPLDQENKYGRLFALKCWCWIPGETERDLSLEPWATWIRDGHLQVTDGNTTDPRSLFAQVEQAKRDYQLKTIAIDPNNARFVSTHLENELDIRTFEFWQTCRKYNEPLREFLKALQEGRILHGGHPLLGWAADNLITKSDPQDYLMPAKAKSPEKIDPIVAVLMGFSECLFAETEQPSVYQERGLRTL